jgi:DNA-binding NarL/FixJ family response regulator
LKAAGLSGRIPGLQSTEEETPLRPEEPRLKQGQILVTRVPGGDEEPPISRRKLDGMANEPVAPRVLIADSDSATRKGIRLALELAGIDVCTEVEGTNDLVDAVARSEPDVCLVSASVAGARMTAAAEVCGREGSPSVVLLAHELNEDDFLLAMRVGAVGYVPMDIAPARLPAVVHAVLRGELAIPRALVARLIRRLRERGTRLHLPVLHTRGVELTSREWEVLDLMREGLSTREIARRLVISEVTVRRLIGGVMKKLQVSTRAEALELLQTA